MVCNDLGDLLDYFFFRGDGTSPRPHKIIKIPLFFDNASGGTCAANVS